MCFFGRPAPPPIRNYAPATNPNKTVKTTTEPAKKLKTEDQVEEIDTTGKETVQGQKVDPINASQLQIGLNTGKNEKNKGGLNVPSP